MAEGGCEGSEGGRAERERQIVNTPNCQLKYVYWNVPHNVCTFYLMHTTIHYSCRYAAAEMDCTVALELDGTYMKAFLRRATARAKLRKFVLARQGG